jgi:hypothetical protein
MYYAIKTGVMERNTEASPVEEANQNPSLRVVEAPRQSRGATTLILPSACHAPRPRPEIAVLGWNVRSYRLSLRQTKA